MKIMNQIRIITIRTFIIELTEFNKALTTIFKLIL